jgi:hypothetical protein
MMASARFPQPIAGNNSGDGSPLVLGDESVIGDLFAGGSAVQVVDWDADGEREVVVSGGNGDIYSYKIIDAIADATPIVDRGLQWGRVSRALHRNERDEGLVGTIAAAADFDGDGQVEVILTPRGYSRKSTVAISLESGPPATRDEGRPVAIVDGPDGVNFGRGNVAVIDWNSDGRLDLVVLESGQDEMWAQHADGTVPEDQRDRYDTDGTYFSSYGTRTLHLYRNTSGGGRIEFTYAGRTDVEVPRHAFHISEVSRTNPSAGILLLNYYGHIHHVPILTTGDHPSWGEVDELFTLHGEPFSRICTMQSHIGVADVLEAGRFDIFAGDNAGNVEWARYRGRDADERPIYDTPRKLKQRNPHVNGGIFSVPTVGDWRGSGMPDLLVGGIEGYIFWYKTLSTDPLRFAPPERVRYGTTEIRRLATPYPAGGQHWGGSQSPYDGDTGGYSNPVLADWNGNGLLDLIVSDMISLFEWYPNRGTATQPELGPPQRLHLTDGSPLIGPWRQQPGIGNFTDEALPDIVVQDLDLDLALYRRAGDNEQSALLPGEKLRYEDGATIKTHGIYSPDGGDGRGRTKIDVVDWDGDGTLDLLIGTGPQHGSPWRGSFVLFFKNVGTNREPLFKRPDILLWDEDGRPLEFWRHGVHMAPVDWDADGKLELVAGADLGHIWYWKPQHFGSPASGDPVAPLPRQGEEGFGPRDEP